MIPGFLIAIVTFPGVIVHEMAHLLFCRWMGIAVLDVCYFRPAEPAGFVIHEAPRTFKQSFFISTGPFFINTLLGAVIAFPGVIPVLRFHSGSPLDYFLLWMGVSIAMHAFPSTTDAKSLWAATKLLKQNSVAKLIAAPVVGLIYLGSFLSMAWLDLLYGAFVCWTFPYLVILTFA